MPDLMVRGCRDREVLPEVGHAPVRNTGLRSPVVMTLSQVPARYVRQPVDACGYSCG
jgi:hypothetical protein